MHRRVQDPAGIDYLILTHAHLYHCGRIPLLVKQGFTGEIITTAASCELARVVLLDSAKLMEDEALRNKIDMTTLIIISGRGLFRGDPSPEASVNLVGIGPGDRNHLTHEAQDLLKISDKILGAKRYLQSIADLTPAEKITHLGPCPQRMAARYEEARAAAQNGKLASILAGGDPSIFGASWRILDRQQESVLCISPRA